MSAFWKNGILVLFTFASLTLGSLAFAQETPTPLPSDVPTEANNGDQNMLQAISQAGRYGIFLQAVEAARLTDLLEEGEDLTIFAPTDDAFGNLPPGRLQELLDDEELLRVLLLNHFVDQQLPSSELQENSSLESIAGQRLTIQRDGNQLRVNGSNVIQPDIRAENGVVHGIDQVLPAPVQD